MKKYILFLGLINVSTSFAYTDLQTIYNQAAQNNGTYQAAVATYKAAYYGVPIAVSSLLPSLNLAANTTAVQQNVGGNYNSNGYTLTLTQPILAIGSWYNYSEAEATYKQAAATFASAEQNLIMTVATDYFAVLEAEDQLKYAQANQSALEEQLRQVESQYKVGLKAMTDVQATRASYESAIATTVADQNNLNTAIQNLIAVTGQKEEVLAPLKQDFPLIKPNPENVNDWVNYGLKNNVNLQYQQFQADINRLQIKTDFTNDFLPTVNLVGTYSSFSNPSAIIANNQTNATTTSNGRVTTKTGSVALNYNIFNGFGNAATVKQDKYNYRAAKANLIQTQRTTVANVTQAYLNVLSDISQVQAQQQAVISNGVALKSMRAGYLAGIRTIVDVLTQQSNLFNSQQQYAQAIYNYVNDSLNLKEQAGNLSPVDIAAVNTWLEQESAPMVANATIPKTTNGKNST